MTDHNGKLAACFELIEGGKCDGVLLDLTAPITTASWQLTPRGFYATRPRIMAVLLPPNPNEFDSAISIERSWA